MGNKAPVVTTSVSSLSYTAGLFGAVAIDAVITVSDADNANLVGATVTVSGNYAGGQDVLGFTNQNGITGSWNAATGVLTLSGASSVANYQAALRSVTFDNFSANPSLLPRTISFVADDGNSPYNLSDTVERTIAVAYGFVDLYNRASPRLRRLIVDQLQRMSLSYFTRRGAGALSNQVTVDLGRVETFLGTIANSLLYAPRFPSNSILQAIAVLGINNLQGLCLTVGARAYLGKGKPPFFL